MSKNKKLLTSGVALVTAAALTLGGTFAWQSISQGAVNEASDVVNPGGRLHNDQHWVSDLENDTNIYVENFIEKGKGDNIYARVRLSEYMEVVMNYGTKAEVVDVVAGSKTLKADVTEDEDGNTLTNDSATRQNKFDYEYAVHDFVKDFDNDDETKNPTSDFFTWTEGKADADRPYFMPTFNKNKDSVAADLNGEYADTLGGISNRKAEQYDYEEITADTEAKTAYAIYDTDSDKDDELKNLSYSDLKMLSETGGKMQNTAVQAAIDNKDIQLVSETHEATQVGTTKGLISMTEWLKLANTTGYKDEKGALTDDGKTALYGYWVYDEDGSGWVYWSAPIAAGETTGLLLDGFKLGGVMDDTWYYAIDVEAQFVTANDVGSVEDNDGFYTIIDTTGGVNAVAGGGIVDDDKSDETTTTTPKAVSDNAETLLKLIGVQIADTTTGDDADDGKDDNNDEEVDTSYTLTLKETTLPEVSFIAEISASAGKGARIVDANGQPVAKENLIVMQAGSELSVGDKASSGSDSEPCAYENGRLKINMASDDLELYQFLVVKLKDTNQFGCFSITTANDPFASPATKDTAVNELFSGASDENVFKIITHDENLVIVPVESLDETLTSNADKALREGTDYTVTYGVTRYDEKQATVTIDARYAGQMLKCYSVKSDGTTYAASVIFVDPSITGGITSPGGGQTDADTHALTLGEATPEYPSSEEDFTSKTTAYVAADFGEAVTIRSTSGGELSLAVMRNRWAVSESNHLELEEGTDYTVDGNTYTFLSSGNIPTGGAMVEVMNADSTEVGYVCLDADDTVDVKLNDSISDAAIVKLGESINYTHNGGNFESESRWWGVSHYNCNSATWYGGVDYTLENGKLTITGSNGVGRIIAFRYTNASNQRGDGVVYLIVTE